MSSINFGNYIYSVPAFKKQPEKAKLQHPENGSVSVVNKRNDKYDFTYQNGELHRVYKNGKFHKAYIRSLDVHPVLEGAQHTFCDGTKLEEHQFYPLEGKNGVESVYVCMSAPGSADIYILKNKQAKYRGEPVYRITHKTGGEAKTVTFVKSDGPEKFEFKTLDEASKYFMEEYGIDAEFMNLKQAFLTKEAVDEFVKLDFQGKGKKIFEGFKIRSRDIENHYTFAQVETNFADSALRNEILDGENPTIEALEALPKEEYRVADSTMYFNTSLDWNNIEAELNLSKISALHRVYDIKYQIVHEFAHYLHSTCSPKQFYINSHLEFEDEEKKAAKEVSVYATTNPDDFVAEYAMGKIAGKTYSKEADELYKKCGGPDLWGNESAA